jgi:glycosyltransferase involved in cell wall biosynthesis
VGIPSDRVRVIPNAVHREEILAAGDRVSDPRPPEAPPDAVWCTWVGSLVRRKDPDLLARVAALACAREQRVHFLVVGAGPLRYQLERALGSSGLDGRVHLIGTIVDGAGIWRYVDFGLSTSRVEGTPNVLLEAMTWGRPYVAPPVGDYAHLVSHEENGLLAQNRSAQELAELVIRLVRDRELRTRLSVNARETAKGFPSPAQVAEQYLNLARSLVQEVESV